MNPTQTTTPTTTNGTNFSLDTSAPGSTVLGGNNTFNSVMNYRDTLANKLQSQYQDYAHTQAPLYDQYAQATQFSPGYLSAYNQNLNDNQAYRQGTLNIRGEVKPMEFLTGEQQQLDLQHSLSSQANAENLNYMEMLRKNNLDSLQSRIGFNQQQYQDQTQATQAGLNYGQSQAGLTLQQQQQGIAQQQLGISQQQANQGRYDYQQIVDPNTGFPQIVTIDKQTGQPVNTAGAGTIGGAPGTLGTQGAGSAALNVMKNLGVQQDLPLNQVVQAYGVAPLVNAIIQNEGPSPKGVLNNPGNIEFRGYNSDGTPKLVGQTDSGIKKADGGTFANYSSTEAGKAAIAAIVQNVAQGKSTVYGANPTLTSFMNKYTNTAPSINNQQTSTPQSNPGAPINLPDGTVVTNPTAIAKISQLPQPYQKYVTGGPQGLVYIDGTRISSEPMLNAIKMQAAKIGVPVLDGAGKSGIQSLDVTFKALNSMSDLAEKTLSSGLMGRIKGMTINQIKKNYQTGAPIVDPDTGETVPMGVLLGNFDQYRDAAIKAVTALSGGPGSGLRLNTSTIETAANNLPTSSDSLESAKTKIATFNKLLTNQLSQTFPEIKPENQANNTAPANTTLLTGPDGNQYHVPNDKVDAFKKAGGY